MANTHVAAQAVRKPNVKAAELSKTACWPLDFRISSGHRSTRMGRKVQVINAADASGSAAGGGDFAAAHAAVSADKSLQFEIAAIPPPPPPPGWLKGLFEFLGAMAPVFEILFWLGVAAIVGALLWLIVREVLRIRLPDSKKAKVKAAEPEWRPTSAAALALLSDADALAEQGRFAEAVHLILLRSIGDIDTRVPNLLRPAFTSRDIGGLSRLPEAARPAFRRIAHVVEASLFGGRDVDRETFTTCRQAYEAFAFPDVWRRA